MNRINFLPFCRRPSSRLSPLLLVYLSDRDMNHHLDRMWTCRLVAMAQAVIMQGSEAKSSACDAINGQHADQMMQD